MKHYSVSTDEMKERTNTMHLAANFLEEILNQTKFYPKQRATVEKLNEKMMQADSTLGEIITRGPIENKV